MTRLRASIGFLEGLLNLSSRDENAKEPLAKSKRTPSGFSRMEVQLLRYWQRDENLEDTTCFSFVESQLFRYVGLSANFRGISEEVEPPYG